MNSSCYQDIKKSGLAKEKTATGGFQQKLNKTPRFEKERLNTFPFLKSHRTHKEASHRAHIKLFLHYFVMFAPKVNSNMDSSFKSQSVQKINIVID